MADSINEILENRISSSRNTREILLGSVIDFYSEGGETVLDVANPQDKYSFANINGTDRPLNNFLDAGRHYHCVNPYNNDGENKIGINFNSFDGMNAEMINELLKNLGTKRNLYMVVMGLAQILTYSSNERLRNRGISPETQKEKNRIITDIFARKLNKMHIKHLLLSDGLKNSGEIDRKRIPEDIWRQLGKILSDSGWDVTEKKMNEEIILAADR
jgi:hypothetical protein